MKRRFARDLPNAYVPATYICKLLSICVCGLRIRIDIFIYRNETDRRGRLRFVLTEEMRTYFRPFSLLRLSQWIIVFYDNIYIVPLRIYTRVRTYIYMENPEATA